VTILIIRRLTNPLRKLVKATHQIGQGDFDLELPRVKRKDEIGVLAKSFSVMLEQLKEHIKTLQQTTAEKEKIESELTIAHTIQMGMLPREFPSRSEFELFAVLDSARAVGGDLYDFFFLDNDHLFISVGDVSGKGVPASLFMTVVRTLFRSRTMDGQPLHQIMSLINKELCKDNPNIMFVTMVAGIINLRTGTIELCNAGHNPPLIMDKEGSVQRKNLFSAIPLGIQEYHSFKTEIIQLAPGDRLVLYTDGITEALNRKGEFYHENSLSKVLFHHRRADVPNLVKEVVKSIHQFADGVEQADDITLLILGYQKNIEADETTMETRTIRIPNQLDQLHIIVETIEELSAEWNISSKASMELNLVLEELFTNIVFYAFPDKKEHLIDIRFSLPPSGVLEIVLMDDGKYFDLIEASEEVKLDAAIEERKVGGLGIHFVKQMMDEMHYQRKGGKNIVTLKKYIK
ncbi:MAG: SpoIIE family protein phosphatase, partial [Bacteroidales bacterium]|nr:SpoIIE family protein phosphatase [Bacteroidales bacterium]